MKKNSILFVFLLAAFAVIACLGGGGCGGSSSGNINSSSNRTQFIAAISSIVDDLQEIADSAVTNRKVVNAIQDIVSQYLVTDASDNTITQRAIGRTFMESSDMMFERLTDNVSFDVAVYVKSWSNKHITVKNGVVTDFVTDTDDFQLTITSTDNHVTKLTITPESTTGYWQAYTGASELLNILFSQQLNQRTNENHHYLLVVYTYSSANVEVTYDGTTLLEGTVEIDYPGKTAVTPDTTSDPVWANTPHEAIFDVTLYPQDNKDYEVVIELDREVKSTGSNSIATNSNLNMYRESTSGNKLSTILDMSAGINASVPSGSTRPSAATVTALDLNIADKLRLAEDKPLDLVSLMVLYFTSGLRETVEEVEEDAEGINDILSDAGLAIYLNKASDKAADVRAMASVIGSGSNEYNHVRFGVQFVGSDEVELVRNIANKEDLQQLRTLIGKVSAQVQILANMLTNSGLLTEVTGNEIIQIVFEDLFGTN
ncbi:MAG: hypothetical protein IJQ56_00835 [Synergistaceae bacterium]|nr:hypothetical protein [Synergistaceae bacterium]